MPSKYQKDVCIFWKKGEKRSTQSTFLCSTCLRKVYFDECYSTVRTLGWNNTQAISSCIYVFKRYLSKARSLKVREIPCEKIVGPILIKILPYEWFYPIVIQDTKKVEELDYTSLFFPTKRQSNHGNSLNILNAQIEFVRNKRLKCMYCALEYLAL